MVFEASKTNKKTVLLEEHTPREIKCHKLNPTVFKNH